MYKTEEEEKEENFIKTVTRNLGRAFVSTELFASRFAKMIYDEKEHL